MACAVWIVAATGMAQEAVRDGFYFSTDLGASFIQDTTVKSSDPSILSGKMKFGTGARFDVGLGYQFGSLAVEFDTGILGSSTDGLENEFGSGSDFTFYQVPFLVNFLWQIPTRSRFHPFVGAGFGGVETVLEDYDLFYGTSDSTFGFGWQGIAGCTYQISSSVDLGVRYKYLGVADQSFDFLNLKMDGTHTHSLMFLVSVKF
jgi:opacity protein-like surface antigen